MNGETMLNEATLIFMYSFVITNDKGKEISCEIYSIIPGNIEDIYKLPQFKESETCEEKYSYSKI
jgi:hypothetical protein